MASSWASSAPLADITPVAPPPQLTPLVAQSPPPKQISSTLHLVVSAGSFLVIMRLLDTHTSQFVEKDPEEKHQWGEWKTKYAILSHTWDKKGEQMYTELREIQKRYPSPEAQPPQSCPSEPENVTSTSSPVQVRNEPSPILPPFQLHSESVSETIPLITPSKLIKSVKRLFHWQCRSARNIESDSSETTVLTPVDAPSPNNPPANDPHGAASNDPPAPSPGDSPPLQTTRLPTALGRFTQSEVEALFRVFVEPELYGLPNPKPPSHRAGAPAALSNRPTSSPEHQPPSPPRSVLDEPDLSPKVREACRIARENGYRYIWIDSCCIDKSSSSELSEAINSMYKWYTLADVCCAYLADVPPGENHHAEGSSFCTSRWFKRGWTLQELIVPGRVEFLAQDWTPIGSKQALFDLVESITKIHDTALLKLKPLDTFSVAQRLSWAAKWETMREEDRAYSLLGIFDINMPTLYGEGDRAFRRLQEQIMQRIPDQSLFAWGEVYLPDFQGARSPTPAENISLIAFAWPGPGPFTRSPDTFADSRNVCHAQLRLPGSHAHKIDYTFTPYGICTTFQMIPLTSDLLSQILTPSEVELHIDSNTSLWYLAILRCEHIQHPGHLLGRICYIPPSESGVELAYTGYIRFSLNAHYADQQQYLFPLSPETIEHCRPRIELKTVYIPNPHPQSHHTEQNPLRSLQYQPYPAIRLVLLTEACTALRFRRGYSADLRDPDPDHPTTHWLTLSKDAHTITVEFRHTLEYDGKTFTMDAEAKLSASREVQLDSAPEPSDRPGGANRHTASSGNDYRPWNFEPGFESFWLSAAGVGVLAVDLRLRFLGLGFYGVVVDVRSDAPQDMPVVKLAPPTPSAVESASEQLAALREIGDGSPSGVRVVNAGDEARQEEAGGCGTASAEARDWRDSAGDGAGSEEVGNWLP